MKSREYNFKPRLGRIRSTGDAKAKVKTHVEKLLRAASGLRAKTRVARGFSKASIAGRYSRRSIVKTRIVKTAGSGVVKQRAHLRYIERDAAREKSTINPAAAFFMIAMATTPTATHFLNAAKTTVTSSELSSRLKTGMIWKH